MSLLWTPSPERVSRATLTRFAAHVGQTGSYDELWRWSVDDIERFWAAIWDFFGVRGSYDRVLGSRTMPGAEWFPGATLNYAEYLLTGRRDDAIAMRFASEARESGAWTWGDLRRETARIRAGLQARGVGRGDRVAAYLPNIPETVAAFLATASLGAVWSSAAPEFGVPSVIDRFAQIEPKVLLAVDGYAYGGRRFDRTAPAARIAVETGAQLVSFGHLSGAGWGDEFDEPGALGFDRVPFAHPLWVVYSSGTTGLPKPIVHGHGGMLLEQLRHMHLHVDAQADDRVFWFTTTGWMMWNFLVGVLLTDASIVLYDGSPAGDVLWDLADEAGVTVFGTGAAYLAGCMKQGIEPARGRSLQIHAVGSTGSPLAPECFDWVYEHLGSETWLFSTSGGTDVCTAFVGGVPTLPVYRGELQARGLGCDVQAFDPAGRPLVGQVGELVITQPLPSMPIGFWGDDDGSRYRDAYFDMYPGVWRHGDWIEITERGTAIISGRSDSTINRDGVRIGTSEIYRAVLALDEVVDALVVDVDGWLPLFVVLREDAADGDELRRRIAACIREACSPRHVPNEIHVAPAIPRTLSGKIVEVPVKRLLQGADPATVVSRGSLADPAAFDWFVERFRTAPATKG